LPSASPPNLPFGILFLPDVTVCIAASLLVHMTVSPTCAFVGFGENASIVLEDAPVTMSMLTVAAKAVWLVVVKTSTATAKIAAMPVIAKAVFLFIEDLQLFEEVKRFRAKCRRQGKNFSAAYIPNSSPSDLGEAKFRCFGEVTV
jgi:Sec-independent protein secretion pathway component TatC